MEPSDARMLESRTPGTRERLATELARLRSQAGLSGRALAEAIGTNQSRVSRIESGQAVPTVAEVDDWAVAAGAPAAVRERLADLTERMHTEVQSWRAAGRPHFQAVVEERERHARATRTFQPSLVPGMLQTPQYAGRVFALSQVRYSAADAADALATRLRRQLALFDEQRRFAFLITEAALRWSPGPPALLLAQYDRIASLSTMDNVSIGLIPQDAAATSAIPHAFVVYDGYDGEQQLAVVEMVHGELTVHKPDALALYAAAWDALARMALFGDEARGMLEALAQASRRPSRQPSP